MRAMRRDGDGESDGLPLPRAADNERETTMKTSKLTFEEYVTVQERGDIITWEKRLLIARVEARIVYEAIKVAGQMNNPTARAELCWGKD